MSPSADVEQNIFGLVLFLVEPVTKCPRLFYQIWPCSYYIHVTRYDNITIATPVTKYVNVCTSYPDAKLWF